MAVHFPVPVGTLGVRLVNLFLAEQKGSAAYF